MTIPVHLTEIEVILGALVGSIRRAESIASGRRNAHGYDGSKAWDIDIEGALAEMAYCKYRGHYWSASVGSFKGADVKNKVQIRHTDRLTGSLIIRQEDNGDHYYVLVTGLAPTFNVVGWIQGRQGKQERFLRAPNNRPGAYFVPQTELKPFSNGRT